MANPFPCSPAADRRGVPQAALRRPRHPRQHRGEVCAAAARRFAHHSLSIEHYVSLLPLVNDRSRDTITRAIPLAPHAPHAPHASTTTTPPTSQALLGI